MSSLRLMPGIFFRRFEPALYSGGWNDLAAAIWVWDSRNGFELSSITYSKGNTF
jgi:hypothetical protein